MRRDAAVEDLEIRAWLDYTEDVSVDDLALVKETPVADRLYGHQACAAVARCGCSALVARCGMYHAYMPVVSVPSTLVLPIARDVFCRPLQDHEISVALKRLDNMIGRC
ncbi:hypothetical protein XGA_4851 [Xanthomonas hortorum ATCC 19865]|nr:hypothetical protein XGA_4851 [Xanthomonas hortorum ATCC 19865]